jgi:RNA polymerase sigma-70 factor (ECF subfamily)
MATDDEGEGAIQRRADIEEEDRAAGLLAAIATGDRAALRALFDAEGPRLLGVAMRILRRRDLAEEAVQDAFVQAWRHAARFDPARGSGRGWLTVIARNAAIDLLRRAAREEPVEIEALEALRESRLRDEQAEMDDILDRLDAAGRLRGCLEALEPQRRRAILMAYALGLTQGEIAGRMGAPLGTVKAWMRRGLLALRECLS